MFFSKTILAATLCAGISLSCVQADEASHKAAAIELVKSLNLDASMKQGIEVGFGPVLKQMEQQGVPAAAIAEVKTAVDEWVKAEVKIDELLPQIAAVYQKEFTEDELTAINNFNKSPAGAKALAKMPTLMQQGAAITQQYMGGKQISLQLKVQSIMQKYKDSATPAK